MLASTLLALREGLEAALIIGVIIGALYKLGRGRLIPAVWMGTAAAGLLSFLAALILYRFGMSLEGSFEKVFEGATMLLAAGVLTWMIFWMKRQSAGMKSALEAEVSAAGEQTPFRSLFFLAFITIIREGIELSLFLTAAAFSQGGMQALLGAALGLTAAAVLGWLLYASSLRLNLQAFFNITSVLLLIFAAGLVAHGVHEFNEIGWIPAIIDPIWNMNHILDEKSALGEILKALFGYNGNPSLTETLAYVSYIAVIAIALRTMVSPEPKKQSARA
ncbi:MAG TPA: iron permease [Caldilineae bacterium]|nr:iron permease [Caldilineae bacterium]HIQ11359.1 iron permease [Caldilineales bacterium]